MGICHNNIGNIHLKNSRFFEAISSYQNAVQIIEDEKSLFRESFSHLTEKELFVNEHYRKLCKVSANRKFQLAETYFEKFCQEGEEGGGGVRMEEGGGRMEKGGNKVKKGWRKKEGEKMVAGEGRMVKEEGRMLETVGRVELGLGGQMVVKDGGRRSEGGKEEGGGRKIEGVGRIFDGQERMEGGIGILRKAIEGYEAAREMFGNLEGAYFTKIINITIKLSCVYLAMNDVAKVKMMYKFIYFISFIII